VTRLVVVGPDLPASLRRHGDLHVHWAGCTDLRRGATGAFIARALPGEPRTFTVTADTRDEAQRRIGAPDHLTTYFAPCTGNLG
jgi:hypothetical protein